LRAIHPDLGVAREPVELHLYDDGIAHALPVLAGAVEVTRVVATLPGVVVAPTPPPLPPPLQGVH